MLQIRPMTAADFDRFWPTFQAVIAARETYAYDPNLSLEQARHLWRGAAARWWSRTRASCWARTTSRPMPQAPAAM